MTQIAVESSAKAAPIASESGRTSRLFFVDALRAALVVLVVLHHVAIVYGEGESFYYVEPPIKESLTYLLLLVFALANQAWFMGAFFLLAGYFTPGSFDRKGPSSFLKERLVRLGIPLVIFYFVLNPISAIGLFLEPDPRIADPLTWQNFRQVYPELLFLGPLWFVAMLLIFSFGYAVWWRMWSKRTSSSDREGAELSRRRIAAFIVALALVSYLLRIVIPIGKVVLDFPTLAYLPQYLSFFILGTMASRHDWLRTLPGSMGRAGLATAVVAFVLLFPVALFGGADGQFLGEGKWQSAVYALWDSAFAVGMSLAAITFFRRRFNKQGRLGRFLSQHGYTVYIIHTPIVVFLAAGLRDVALENFPKFGLVSLVAVPACFAAAYLIRKIPFATRIL